jgi:hypothetical protein
MWVAAVLVTMLGIARVYLGVDHPSDAVFGAIGGAAVATLAFRLFVPDEIFPVRYDSGKAAHLAIDERREDSIRRALDEQTGLELVSVEPFGEEGSGGSTPLRFEVRRSGDGRRETLFGKLYSAGHLRADRWYKLSRTICTASWRTRSPSSPSDGSSSTRTTSCASCARRESGAWNRGASSSSRPNASTSC